MSKQKIIDQSKNVFSSDVILINEPEIDMSFYYYCYQLFNYV